MRFSKVLILLTALFFTPAFNLLAQERVSAAQTAENLRAQLREVEAESAELQARAEQLDWESKPENIARYFAATGTTRPEELREQRRRQLQIEKEYASERLAQLSASRARLETTISTADAEAYTESAQGFPTDSFDQMLASPFLTNTSLLAGVLALIATAGVLALGVVIHRRRRVRTSTLKRC
ncbi:MAG TPA: hypothetical protein VGC87_07975 [Pyrinomonadaceae bacterium]|jgi:hypothetical protein